MDLSFIMIMGFRLDNEVGLGAKKNGMALIKYYEGFRIL